MGPERPPFGRYVLIKTTSEIEDPNDPEGSKFAVAKRVPVNEVNYVGRSKVSKGYIWEAGDRGFYSPDHVESWTELPRED